MLHRPALAVHACALLLVVGTASASEPPAADGPFGTTPARPRDAPEPSAIAEEAPGEFAAPPPGTRRAVDVAVATATEPPQDWAVLHVGLRPHLGTFAGIATVALAHARTERFVGGVSFSGIRNDAGTHIGLAQLAIGRSLADEFVGGAQVSLTENRARSFVGLTQTSIVYNRAGTMTAALQLAGYNRSGVFQGALQLGAYNRTDDEFRGLVQLGAFDLARGDFSGIAQVGAASVTSGTYAGVAQVGAFVADASTFHGVAQIGAVALSRASVGAQIGAVTVARDDHAGLQLGPLAAYAGEIDGIQIGIANFAERARGVQIGLFNHARSLRGVQIGLANHAEDGVLPWTAILNMGFDSGDAWGDDDAPRAALARPN